MAKAFEPRIDILPPAQRVLWREFASLPPQFTLYGGTALALHLGHRQSEDFDFFGEEAFEPEALKNQIELLRDAVLVQAASSTLTSYVERQGRVKVSFFGVPNLKRIAEPLVATDTGLRVAALPDLAGTKIAVLQLRSERKDYLDVHALIERAEFTLPEILACGAAVHGASFNAYNAVRALASFEEGSLAKLPRAVKDDLRNAALTVDLDRLPDAADIIAR